MDRTEIKAAITALAATVDLSELKSVLNEMVDDACLLDDVAQVQTATSEGGTLTIDFTNYDRITANLDIYSQTLAISGVNDGEFKFLTVLKNILKNISFTGATDLTMSTAYVTALVTEITYFVFNKGNTGIFLFPLKETMVSYLKSETYSRTEIDELLDDKEDALTNKGWLDGSKVASIVETSSFKCKCAQWGSVVTCNGQLKLTGTPTGQILFTLNALISVPTVDVYFTAVCANGSTTEGIELKVEANTRNVYSVDSSQDQVGSYNFSYIAI